MVLATGLDPKVVATSDIGHVWALRWMECQSAYLALTGLYPFLVLSCFGGAAMQSLWGDVFEKGTLSESPFEIDRH